MANDELTDRIRDEVERILGARYPVAFTALSRLLGESQHGLEIELFAIGSPCRLRGLAHAVRDFLELRPTAIVVLQQLSRSPQFSRCFVREFPEFAVSVLEKVITDYATYSELALNLACSWARETGPVPSIFEQLTTEAANAFLDESSDLHLWGLYKLGQGPRNLSEILNEQLCRRLESQLINIARRREVISGTLSIALLLRLQGLHDQDLGEADQFFAGDNTVKILHWVLLQIALISRSLTVMPASEIEDLLDVIADFASRLGKQAVSTWLARNDSVSVVTKLCSLAADSRLSATARWKIATIVQRNRLVAKPQVGSALPLDELISDLMSDRCAVMNNLECLELGQNINRRVPTLQATSRVLTESLDLAAKQQLATREVNSCLNATTIVRTYRAAVATDSAIRAQILTWLVQLDEDEVISTLQVSSGGPGCEPHHSCSRSSVSVQYDLQIEISRLMMTSIAVDSNKLEAQLVVRICDAHHQLSANRPTQCTAWQLSRPVTPSLPRAAVTCTPAGHGTSGSWIADVRAMVNAESRVRQDSIVHFVQQMCQDLEERCQNAEAPWLHERRIRQSLEEQIAKLHQELNRLQADYRGLEEALEAQESEKVRLEASLSEQDDLAGNLRRQVEALQAQANTVSIEHAEGNRYQREQALELQQQIEALRTASIGQQKHYMAELEAMRAANVDLEIATGAELEEAHTTIGEQQRMLQRLQVDHEHLNAELQSASAALDHSKAELDIGNKALRDLTHACAVQKAEIDSMAKEKDHIVEKHEFASREALRTEITVKELITNLQELKLRHEKTAEQFVTDQEANQAETASRISALTSRHANEVRDLKEIHDTSLDQAAAKAQALRSQYDSQINTFRAHITQQETHLARKRQDLSVANQANADLEVILAEKEEQLESLLLSMKTSMMQALGTRPKPKAKTPRKSGLVHKDPYRSPYSKPLTPTTPAIAPFDDGEDASIACTLPRALGEELQQETIIEPTSTNSSFAGGPTPKRQKPQQRPFKVPMIKPPRLSRKAEVLIVASPVHQQALQDVSKARANRSPVKSGRRQSLRVSAKKLSQPAPVLRKVMPDPIEEDFGDDDFGSELLTSTQFSPSKSAFRVAGAGFNDDTTMDV